MKVRFLENTNIRKSITDLTLPPVGVIFGGVELEVEDQIYFGAHIANVNEYFLCKNGFFYWRGRALILYRTIARPEENTEYEEIIANNNQEILQKNITIPEAAQGEQTTTSHKLEKEKMVLPQEPIFTIRPEKVSTIHQTLKISTSFWLEKNLYGKDIRIGILDTGVERSHPDLQDAIEEYQDFTSNQNPLVGNVPDHSQASALLIAGRGIQCEYGLAPQSTLILAKVTNDIQPTAVQSVLSALEWIKQKNLHVLFINVSLAESQLSKDQKISLESLVNYFYQNNVVVVAPVGDSLYFTPENRYPGAFGSCLSVGSYNEYGQRANYSMKSFSLDLLAPEYSFHQKSSTGFSAAIVAGIAGLLQACRIREDKSISVQLIYEILRQSASQANRKSIDFGYGIIRPGEAVNRLIEA